MEASRRQVLTGAAATAVAYGGVRAFPARAARAAPGPVRPAGTTLDSTVVRGPKVNAQGYVRLVTGAGEPFRVRDELGTPARAGRAGRRREVLSFAQLTDIHVLDAQSPARVEYLDRYNDGPGAPLFFSAAYRPHEFLTPQLADSIVSAVASVGVGPAAGRPLAFAICTGDNNECHQGSINMVVCISINMLNDEVERGPPWQGSAS